MTVTAKWVTVGGDLMIAHMARVSNPKATLEDPSKKLIGYLIRNHHWSPFEMANMCLEIETQRDISAQILRHRSFSFQEFSTRYAQVSELLESTECRFQHQTNRQMSLPRGQVQGESFLGHNMDETVAFFNGAYRNLSRHITDIYEELIRRGVAKEVARRILPIGMIPTKLYMNGTVRSWIHYCAERTKPGTQLEHRRIAVAAALVLNEHFPQTFEAVVEEGLIQKENLSILG
jgi:thymidylate synthase (FAD)